MTKKQGLPKRWGMNILIFLCGTENKHIDRTSFWTMILAVFTAILFTVGFYEITEYRKTMNAQFLMDFNNATFTPDERQLIMLLENDLLTFKENNPKIDTVENLPKDFGCFIIKKNYQNINKLLLDSNKILYSSYEIDDILLNKFDALGTYERNGIVNIKDVYPVFHFYIFTTWENNEILKYMNWLSRKYPGQNYFKDLKSLYSKLKAYETRDPEITK